MRRRNEVLGIAKTGVAIGVGSGVIASATKGTSGVSGAMPGLFGLAGAGMVANQIQKVKASPA